MLNGEERVWMERGTIMGQISLRKRAAAGRPGLSSQRSSAPLGHCYLVVGYFSFVSPFLSCFYRFNSHQAESGLIMFEASKTFEKSTSFSGPVFAMARVLKYLTWGLNSALIS